MDFRKFLHICALCVCALTLAGCKTPKLATANEQFARGEYFDASKTYRAVYNKLKTASSAARWPASSPRATAS